MCIRDRFQRDFPKALVRDCQDVIGKIQVAGGIGAADIVFLISAGSNQAFGVGDDLVIAALPGGIFPLGVVNFPASVDADNQVFHLPVDKIHHFIRHMIGIGAVSYTHLDVYKRQAMIYVVVEELIPEAHLGEHSHSGTLGVIAGFVIMMVLDTALG